ncbi:MAG TPA: YciI family protein [Nonomuraea sp.]|nr:YciI family protein [Nonomuraea sp.]
MAQFAIMVYAPTPADWMSAPPEELEAHGAYAAKTEEMGFTTVSAYAFQSSDSAKAVRKDGIVEDGPFVQAEYVLGGISIIEARDIDHALEIAKLSPATWRGGVEVRPVM